MTFNTSVSNLGHTNTNRIELARRVTIQDEVASFVGRFQPIATLIRIKDHVLSQGACSTQHVLAGEDNSTRIRRDGADMRKWRIVGG
ncbi:hypothetical protein TSUD_65050 [Trifolium subterraneum]|uniref:Uncharacterized protein n=1 Tax=Trifolium subterraneum TaxID=3900 RepID=A0A2Z6N0C0_TRISU|nr:hypothetical protein TSUD_65050 [Trifolium subterraneum]